MKSYKEFGDNINEIAKKLVRTSGMSLAYIKQKSDTLDGYINYTSSGFFDGKSKINQYDIEEKFVIIQSILDEYKVVETEIKDTTEINKELQDFLMKKIEENIIRARIAQKAILFEAEKAGYDIAMGNEIFEVKKNIEKINSLGLNEEHSNKKELYLEEINSLQNQIYGERISDTEDERSLVISICNQKYEKNKSRLQDKEKMIFEDFLERFKEYKQTYKPARIEKLEIRSPIKVKTIMEGTEHIKQAFYPNIDWTQNIQKGAAGYMTSSLKKVREYPDKVEDSFNSILTTLGHEDGGHMVRADNQEKNGLLIAGAGHEDIEEGITKLNEGLLKYSLDNYPLVPNEAFITIFIGENYNFQDTYTLIKILKKLNAIGEITHEKEKKIEQLALTQAQRVKSYYPRDEAGANRKDTIYFRGEKKLVQYLRSLPNNEERAIFYRKAMSAKVSFEDIFRIDSLLENTGVEQQELNYNKLVDKVFNEKLKNGAGAFSKIANENGTTNIEENLLKGDFRFNGIEEYKEKEKQAIVDLFSIIGYKKYRGKYIEEQQRKQLKDKDLLKKGNIISYKENNKWKKGMVITSSLDELQIALQEDGKYKGNQTETIKKKDIEKLENIRILNKQSKIKK